MMDNCLSHNERSHCSGLDNDVSEECKILDKADVVDVR